MLAAITGLVGIVFILGLVEIAWRNKLLKLELSRKVVHILAAVWIAFWPSFVPWNYIVVLGVIIAVVAGISKYFKLFQSIHDIDRKSFGEIAYGLGIAVTALLTHNHAFFSAAILVMGLGDGLAAVVGQRFGKDNQYHPTPGTTKTLAGTMAFFIMALLILMYVAHFGFMLSGLTAMVLASIENLMPLGTDNVVTPIIAVILLRLL